MSKERKINHCLDALKGIACIGVVFVHALFPGVLGSMVLVVGTAFVPLFFLIVGFYSYRVESQEVARRGWKKIKYMTCMTFGALSLYVVWMFVKIALGVKDIQNIIAVFNVKNLIKFVTLNDTTMFDGGHLWFLCALLYCYFFLFLFSKVDKVKWLYFLLPVAFVLRVLATKIGNWHYTQNFWVDGFPYFFLGYCLNQNAEIWQKMDKKILISLSMFGIAFSEIGLFGGPFIYGINIYEIGTIVFAIAVFMFALKLPDFGKGSKLETLGRKYSLFVYIGHFIILEFVRIIEGKLGGVSFVIYDWLKPILIVILTVILAVLYEKMKKKFDRRKYANC